MKSEIKKKINYFSKKLGIKNPKPGDLISVSNKKLKQVIKNPTNVKEKKVRLGILGLI